MDFGLFGKGKFGEEPAAAMSNRCWWVDLDRRSSWHCSMTSSLLKEPTVMAAISASPPAV